MTWHIMFQAVTWVIGVFVIIFLVTAINTDLTHHVPSSYISHWCLCHHLLTDSYQHWHKSRIKSHHVPSSYISHWCLCHHLLSHSYQHWHKPRIKAHHVPSSYISHWCLCHHLVTHSYQQWLGMFSHRFCTLVLSNFPRLFQIFPGSFLTLSVFRDSWGLTAFVAIQAGSQIQAGV